MAGFYLTHALILTEDGTHPHLVGINCTDEEFSQFTKRGRRMHPYVIPDNFLMQYLESHKITVEKSSIAFMGITSIEDKSIVPNILIYKTELGYEIFVSVRRIKQLFEELNTDRGTSLNYEDFIDAYCEHLKTI